MNSVQLKSKIFVDGLQKIASENPNEIIQVKGKGLLLGLQFKPEFDIGKVVQKCRENGLLVITAGMNTVRLVPALNIPDEAIKEGLDILSKSIAESK